MSCWERTCECGFWLCHVRAGGLLRKYGGGEASPSAQVQLTDGWNGSSKGCHSVSLAQAGLVLCARS